MKIKTVGASFRQGISHLRPEGIVLFEAEPNNPVDPTAVKVMYEGACIGYLPKTCKAKENLPKSADIVEAYYADAKFAEKADWATEGSFIGMMIEIEEVEEDEQPRFRVHNGKKYERISSFLSRTKHLYETPEAMERLKDWNKRNENGLENTARLGTIIHNLLEEQAKDDAKDLYVRVGDKFIKHQPCSALNKFMEKYNLKMVDTEQIVYCDKTGLCGKYDLGCDDATVDYKSSKQTQLSHRLQTSFYSKARGKKRGFVFRPNDNTKQKYSVTEIDVEKEYAKLLDIIKQDKDGK